MAVKDIFKVNRRTFFNPRAWLGYDALKQQTLDVYNLIRQSFANPLPGKSESYDEALTRLEITNAEAQQTGRTYFIYSLVFFIVGSATFVFSFLLLIYYSAFLGWLLGMAVSALLFTQAFRYNFWHFQIKHKKLGCTFEEWKNGKISSTGGPNT